MTDDSELLRRFVDGGCNEAFSELVHRHVDLVFSAALRVVGGDVQLAEEVTQSVFVVLARKAPTLIAHPVLGGWLYRCAQFTAVDAIRAEQRRSTRLGAATMISSASDNAADAEWKRIGPMIDALLIELNEQDRNAIVLRYFEGRSFGEIGAALRLTEDAARMRINRALDRLRALLAKRGVRSTAAALGAALIGNGIIAAPANLAAAATSKALSAAAVFSAGTATHVTILGIMSTSKSIATIAVIAAALSLGIAVRQTMALHEVQRAAPLRATAAVARNAKPTLAPMNIAADASARTLPPHPTSSEISAEPLGSVVPFTASMGLPDVDFNNAETRKLVVQQRALRARQSYEALFRRLQLTPAQQEQFINALSEYDQQMIDLAMSMQGITPSIASELKQETIGATMAAELSGKMQSLLGPDGFKQYRQYTSELQVRPVVDALVAQLLGTSEPLTDAQVTNLTTILDNTRLGNLHGVISPNNSMGGVQLPPEAIGLAKLLSSQQDTERPRFVTDEAITKAEGVLDPTQIAALRRLQAEQFVMLKLAPALLASATGKR